MNKYVFQDFNASVERSFALRRLNSFVSTPHGGNAAVICTSTNNSGRANSLCTHARVGSSISKPKKTVIFNNSFYI